MPWQAGRRIRAQAPFLAVVAIMVFAFGYLAVAPEHWRRGAGIISSAMLLGGVLRALLPGQLAGMLAVRGRWWDVVCYLAPGVAIIVLAIRLPH